jgi:hypothetical protein
LRLADDDVTENGDNHQRVCRNLSKCKFTVNLSYSSSLYMTHYHGQGEAHKRVHLAEKVTKNPSAGKTGNNVEPKI